MSKPKQTDATLRNWLGDEVKQLPPAELVEALDSLYATGPSPAEQQQAQAAVWAALEAELPPVIHYDVIEDGPFSPIYVAAGPQGLVAVDFGVSEQQFVEALKQQTGGRVQHTPSVVARGKAEVADYVRGARAAFDIEVDLSMLTPFQRRVLEEARRVPRGQTATYGEIAERIGKPKASRAVGQALRRNPVPIVVPCHRVVNADGTLGGYGGKLGSERKVRLLQLEGVVFA